MSAHDEIRKLSPNYAASGFLPNAEWEAMYRHGWNACEEAAAEIVETADRRIAALESALNEWLKFDEFNELDLAIATKATKDALGIAYGKSSALPPKEVK